MRRRTMFASGGALVVAGSATYIGLGQASMEAYEASVAATRATLLASPDLQEFVRFASLAPSGHNTQPWRFQIAPDRIVVLPDFSRRTPVVDPDNHHLFVGLGCAAENLALAARARGRAGEIAFDPTGGGCLSVQLGYANTTYDPLFDAIPWRQTTRVKFDGRSVSKEDLRSLAAAANVSGSDLALLTNQHALDRVRDLVVAGNSIQLADPSFVGELKSWLRFNPAQAMQTGDGLFTVASGNPALPSWLGPTVFDWMFTASAENDRYARHMRSSPGVAVFVAQRANPEHWMRVGRACQRFALQATALGVKLAFVNQPVEVASLRPDLAQLVGQPMCRPDIVMRFGYGKALPLSARRPVKAILA